MARYRLVQGYCRRGLAELVPGGGAERGAPARAVGGPRLPHGLPAADRGPSRARGRSDRRDVRSAARAGLAVRRGARGRGGMDHRLPRKAQGPAVGAHFDGRLRVPRRRSSRRARAGRRAKERPRLRKGHPAGPGGARARAGVSRPGLLAGHRDARFLLPREPGPALARARVPARGSALAHLYAEHREPARPPGRARARALLHRDARHHRERDGGAFDSLSGRRRGGGSRRARVDRDGRFLDRPVRGPRPGDPGQARAHRTRGRRGARRGDPPNRACPEHLYSGITIIGKAARIPEGVSIGRNARIAPDVAEEDFPGGDVAAGEALERPKGGSGAPAPPLARA